MNRPDRKPAFTLIELLVVVAIIVALLAILLPSMNKAIAVANTAVCASNLHQIGIGMLSYHANERVFPQGFNHSGSFTSLRGVVEPNAVWTGQTRKYAGGVGATDVFYCPEAPAESIWEPKFGSSNPAKYGYEAGEMWVPGAPPTGNSYGYNNNGTRTTDFQQGVGDDPEPGNGAHSYYTSIARVFKPAEFLVLADSKLDGVWDAFVDYQVAGEDISDRHDGRANFLLADGHAMTVDDPEAYEDNTGVIGVDLDKGRIWNRDHSYP